jgi:molybdopterin converting factor small subunit
MAVLVLVPAEWSRATGGARQVEASGRTVAECLAELGSRYPELPARLAGQHEVFLNRENVRFRQGQDTPVSAGDVIQVVPARI